MINTLFERHSLSGHPAPSREKRKGVAVYTPSSIGGYSEGVGTLRAHGGDIGGGSENLIAARMMATAYDMKQHHNPQPSETVQLTTQNCSTVRGDTPLVQPIPLNTMTMQGRPSDDGRMGSGIGEPGDPCPTLTKAHSHAVAQPIAFSRNDDGGDATHDLSPTMRVAGNAGGMLAAAVGTDLYNGNITGDVAATMGTPGSSINASGPTVMQAMAVRRLTPVECERLQGFGDNYTNIKSKGKPTPDGPRYKALGNSMAVPVMAWIGQRIRQVEQLSERDD